MIDLFIFRLVLSFFVGAVWIILLTILAEKFGTKIGGAIAGIPATMVAALFFIGYTQDAYAAYQSTTLVPLMLGINTLFVMLFVILSRFNFYFSLIISLVFWFITAYIITLSKFNNFQYSILIYATLIIVSYYVFEKRLSIKSKDRAGVQYNNYQLLIRGLIGGTTIAIAILLAKVAGPLIGGIFASFPALTVALIIILYFNQGINFSVAFLKNFIISGTLNVLIFVISIRITYQTLGIFYGTLISFTISLLCSYLTYKLINKRMA